MKTFFNKSILALLVGGVCLTSASQLHAASRNSTYIKAPKASSKSSYYKSSSRPKYSSKGYRKKGPYEGLGKKSERTGQIKTKPVRGHFKKTSKGYTYVNPYAKSKSPRK